MFYRRERESASALSALMAQTEDSMVCFKFRVPIDPREPSDVVDAKLRDAIVVEASAPFARFFGFEHRKDIIGQHLYRLFNEQIPSWFVDYGQEVEDRNFSNIERVIQIPTRRGSRPMRIYMQNIFEDDQLVSQWVTIRDISKEQAQDRAIAQGQRLQDLALEAVGLRNFTIEFPETATTWQAAERSVVWRDRVHIDDQPIVEDAFRRFYDGETERLHVLFRSPKDEERWWESWAVAGGRAADGTPTGFVGVVMDRTQSKALEARMIASQRLESLGVLAGGIAHDFNNLLMSITGSVDVLEERYPDLANELRVIDEASVHASNLCDQLLTYAGRGPSEFSNLELATVISRVMELLSVSVDDNATLTTALDPDCWVSGDAGQLSQLCMNLVKNASDALEGNPGTIRLSTTRTRFEPAWRSRYQLGATLKPGPYISLRVEDSGKGIEPSELDQLFDPFYTTKFTGRGLGLAVVMGVVRNHGGAIRVDSNPNRGTVFEVVMPQVSARSSHGEPVALAAAKLSGCVLVVDDEERVRSMVQRLLTSIGVDCESVDSGQAAIDLVQQAPERFDAIMMDVSMPGLDGVEAASRLLEAYPDLKIVMCSGYSAVAFSKLLNHKVSYLQKPYRMQQLREILSALLPAADPV